MSRVDEMISMAGLEKVKDKRIKSFSLGMKQRLGIGTALISDPDTIILDEPFNGLDVDGIRWLRKIFRNFADFLSVLCGVILLLKINVTEGRTLTESSGIEVVDITYLGMDVAAIMMIIYAALFLSNNVINEAIHFNLAITPNRLKFFMAKIIFVSLLSFIYVNNHFN